MHEELVNRLGGLSLPRKSVVSLTDRLDMTLEDYRGRKTTTKQQQKMKPDKSRPESSVVVLAVIVMFTAQKRLSNKDTVNQNKLALIMLELQQH